MSLSGNGSLSDPDKHTAVHRVVVRLQNGTVIKGHFPAMDSIRALAADGGFLSSFFDHKSGFIPKGYSTGHELKWPEVKAVFFVTSFEGDRALEKVHFYGQGPEIKTIWVEITFRDGEVIEGYMKNALPKLGEGGFFLRPSNTESNNLLAFVNLSAVACFRVLGVSTSDCI